MARYSTHNDNKICQATWAGKTKPSFQDDCHKVNLSDFVTFTSDIPYKSSFAIKFKNLFFKMEAIVAILNVI